MPDRDKVIKGLELCLKTIDEPDCRKECPYYEACQKYEGRVIFQPLMRDTLALLKKQEPKPVGKEWNECPNCGKVLSSIEHIHFCGICGQAVKWDA